MSRRGRCQRRRRIVRPQGQTAIGRPTRLLPQSSQPGREPRHRPVLATQRPLRSRHFPPPAPQHIHRCHRLLRTYRSRTTSGTATTLGGQSSIGYRQSPGGPGDSACHHFVPAGKRDRVDSGSWGKAKPGAKSPGPKSLPGCDRAAQTNDVIRVCLLDRHVMAAGDCASRWTPALSAATLSSRLEVPPALPRSLAERRSEL